MHGQTTPMLGTQASKARKILGEDEDIRVDNVTEIAGEDFGSSTAQVVSLCKLANDVPCLP